MTEQRSTPSLVEKQSQKKKTFKSLILSQSLGAQEKTPTPVAILDQPPPKKKPILGNQRTGL